MPRKYDDEDDDDLPPIRKDQARTGMDAFFGNTSTPVLVLFGICCGCIALILSIIGLATCKDETARSNAKLVLIVCLVSQAVGIVIRVILTMAEVGAGGGRNF